LGGPVLDPLPEKLDVLYSVSDLVLGPEAIIRRQDDGAMFQGEFEETITQ
jgi:hypothetical protein